MKNLIKENPAFFANVQARKKFCHENHFMPIYDFMFQPNKEGIVYPATQFFCTADYRPEVWKRWQKGEEVKRVSENLVPTAFLFEADGISLEEQKKNINLERLNHVLSITYSGSKSLHVIVPILPCDGFAMAGNSQLYKACWAEVAKRLFKDISVLDERCASIGRLSRMPGATRYKRTKDGKLDLSAADKEQRCIFLNDAVEPLRLGLFIDDYKFKQRRKVSISSMRSKPPRREGDADEGEALRHLRRSAEKFPTPSKEVALIVLDKGQVPLAADLPKGGDYWATFTMLARRFPKLSESFYEFVKEHHPTRFPETYDKALLRVAE